MFLSKRIPILVSDIGLAITDVHDATMRAIAKHGNATLISDLEILGVIEEELNEFKLAIRGGSDEDKYRKLLALAVGSVFGLISYSVSYRRNVH